MVGAGRAFGYDASVTMDNFVTGSLSDVFTRQIVFNNHPLLSLAEHMVWKVTGSTGEVTMRVAPALFAAAAVGVLTWRVARKWGSAAGVASGLVLAAHPTLTSQRDVRGYTLAVLAIVVMGVAVLDVHSPALFATGLAVGVGTHVYAVLAGLALVAVLLWFREFNRVWRLASAVGLLAGLSCYAAMLGQIGRSDQARLFRPTFPRDAGWELLGGNVVAVIALGALVAFALRQRPRAPALLVGATTTLGILLVWIVGPTDLYPRFVYFAVPAVALAAGAAVRRTPQLLVLGVVAAIAMLVPDASRWTDDELPNRQLAEVAVGRVCGVGFPAQALHWYEPSLVLTDVDCPTAAILSPDSIPDDVKVARGRWPVLCWSVPGAELRGRVPADCPR